MDSELSSVQECKILFSIKDFNYDVIKTIRGGCSIDNHDIKVVFRNMKYRNWNLKAAKTSSY